MEPIAAGVVKFHYHLLPIEIGNGNDEFVLLSVINFWFNNTYNIGSS